MTDVKLVHPLKASPLIRTTGLGIVSVVKPVQLAKATYDIVSAAVSEKLIEVSPVHVRKAP